MATNTSNCPNEAFIDYLNTLHNASANNQSAITELSITNPYFVNTMVQREVGKYIKESLEKKPAHIFVLTGHAGDGKTGLLFQTLRAWKAVEDGVGLKLTDVITIPSGKQIRYVKDFKPQEIVRDAVYQRKANFDLIEFVFHYSLYSSSY